MDFASIMSKEYADKLAGDGNMEQLNQKPLGTGPFTFVDYQPDAVIRYKANPDYWGGKQKIDDLVFAITPDAAVRGAEAQGRRMPDHALSERRPTSQDLKADTDLKVIEQAGLNVGLSRLQHADPPFDKPEVRKALNMAINKQAIVDAVFQGAARWRRTRSRRPCGPTTTPSKDDPYDPEAAKKMLADAGVKDLT